MEHKSAHHTRRVDAALSECDAALHECVLPFCALARTHASPQFSALVALQNAVAPKVGELQRTITEHMQPVRDRTAAHFKSSELGRRISERAQGSATQKPLEPWEKELISKLEGQEPSSKKK